MEKNLKRVIAIVLVTVALLSCTACGASETPKTFTAGYSKAEQSLENRMSRAIDGFIVEKYGAKQTYTVKDFKEVIRDGNFYDFYEFKIVLKLKEQKEEFKTYEMSCIIDYKCQGFKIVDSKQID